MHYAIVIPVIYAIVGAAFSAFWDFRNSKKRDLFLTTVFGGIWPLMVLYGLLIYLPYHAAMRGLLQMHDRKLKRGEEREKARRKLRSSLPAKGLPAAKVVAGAPAD
jgi:hypothetical protein